jgi:pyruvate kinase
MSEIGSRQASHGRQGPQRTKIVCTLGPASRDEECIEALLRAGMNVARVNFSHGTREEHATTIARVRAVAARLRLPVAILQDLQGPKIRTGALVGGRSVTLRPGQRFTITTRPIAGTAERVATTYAAFPQDVKSGDRVLLADGAIELRVTAVRDEDVATEVVTGGVLAEHQGINLPGVHISAPSLTTKDREDLTFGVQQDVDYIALSFVRRAEDVAEAKRLVWELAQPSDPTRDSVPVGPIPVTPVIAKLEKPEALEHLDAILRAADGVMVARGDLGVEMPLEQVPLIQKRIIARANALGLLVITATQMLESMLTHPRPTRAEASDVANAILDGTDAVMLSGETAVGRYPVEAVRMMRRIAEATEGACPPGRSADEEEHATLAHAVASAAHTLARQAHARLIVDFTRSGLSAHLISKERPQAPIVAFTLHEAVCRRLSLWWGVTPMLSVLVGTTEELIAWVDARLRAEGLAQPGDEVVIMGGMPVAGTARTNFVQLQRVGNG